MTRDAGFRAARHAAWLACVLLLAACATRGGGRGPREPGLAAQAAREMALRSQETWGFTGRIAVNDGRDGGSGRISWRQRGSGYVIEIQAPVSRRTWRLRSTAAGAVLEGLEGGARSGPDAENLLSREVGWRVPFADLSAWARGARGAGPAELEFDPGLRPVRLQQRGWTVEYKGWTETDPPLPTRIFATRGEQRVRLAVERWNAGASGD
jgi:outer membrane lipoprotein LolB